MAKTQPRYYGRISLVARLVAVMALSAVASVALGEVHVSRGADQPLTRAQAAAEWDSSLMGKAQDSGSIPVIVELRVRLEPEARLPDQAAIGRQRAQLATVLERVLERVPNLRAREAVANVKRFQLYPGFALQATPDDLRALAADPQVKAIHEDRVHAPLLHESVALIGGDSLGTFSSFTGAGQVIAILDTGVDEHDPFLSGKILAEGCFSTTNADTGWSSLCPEGLAESSAPNSARDCDLSIFGCGHGTHVAGIAAGSGPSFSGVARNSDLIAVQVFSRVDGETCTVVERPSPCVVASDSDIMKGLEFVFDLRDEHDVASVNMSLGGGSESTPCLGDPMQAVILNLKLANIATVVASGNSSDTQGIAYPACIPEAISVGSTDKQDIVSSFTSSANFLDLLAPGQWIYSSVVGNGYASYAGTSMAAPHVAGAWAVIREALPSASVDDVLNALKDTGVLVADSRAGANDRLVPRIRVVHAISQLGAPAPALPVEMANNNMVSELSGNEGSLAHPYFVEVPVGTTQLEIRIFGGAGDADLLVREGTLPTLLTYDCRPRATGNDETCIIDSPDAGTWYISLYGFTDFEGVNLSVSYTAGSTCGYEEHEIVGGLLSGVQTVVACRTITSAETGVTVTNTADVHLIAGERVRLGPGFRVDAGGVLRASIDPTITP